MLISINKHHSSNESNGNSDENGDYGILNWTTTSSDNLADHMVFCHINTLILNF